VANLADVAPGTGIKVEVGDHYIAVFNVGGTIYAVEAYCSHALALLTEGRVVGEDIECPLHAALFSLKTGKALREPATEDLRTYPIKIESGAILVGVQE
jgi:3-phenylpropionate/trans-cinnamate dioxygenase ferredoxin subunit